MHAIIVWGVLVSGAAIVVADESVTERVTDKSVVISKADNVNKVDNNIDNKLAKSTTTTKGISYRRWLQNAEWNENLSPNFGSFVVTRDQSLGIVGDIGEQWRQALLDTTDIREDLRAFARAALVGQEYDFQASGESKLSYLSRRLPDIATDTLSAWGGQWAERNSAIEHVNVEWRTDLGERSGHFALDVVGGLRETADDVWAWQARGFVATGGDDNVDSGANVGLIWRKAALDNTALIGINGFLDFEKAYDINFWRWSLGVESHFGAFDFSANHYHPITDGEEVGNFYIYSAKGRDVQAYVRLADFFQQHLFVDVAAGVTYYRWSGERGTAGERDGTDEGLRYGVRIGSYLNTPQSLMSQPLALELELDEENDVRGRLSYLHYFGAANSSFAATESGGFQYEHTTPYNPRTQFYSPVRREYAQRIRRKVVGRIHYEIRSRATNGFLRLGNTVNLYAGVMPPPSFTVAILTVTSPHTVLTVSDIVQEYKLSLVGSGIGASLLMNNLSLTEQGEILLTAGIPTLGSTVIITAEVMIEGVSPSGLQAQGIVQFFLQDKQTLSPPILLPPTPPDTGGGTGGGTDGNEEDNNPNNGIIGGGNLPEIGIDGNNYLARVPTPEDSVLLGGIGVVGSVPPYLITLLNGHTSPRLLGISLMAAAGRLIDYQPPHRLQIYGGHADIIWHEAVDPDSQNVMFTIAISSSGERQERLLTVVPQQFEIGFSQAQLTLTALAAGQSRTVSGVSLTLARYSGLPPYRYTVTGADSVLSFYSLTQNVFGLLHNSLNGSALNAFMLTVTVTDAGGREAEAILSVTVNVSVLNISTSAGEYTLRYPPNITRIAEQEVYTLSLSGTDNYFARISTPHERLGLATIDAANGVYAIRVLAGPTMNFTATVTITYGDTFGRRGETAFTVKVLPARYVIETFSQLNPVSRAVTARQIILTMGIQLNDANQTLDRYEVKTTSDTDLSTELSRQIVIVDNRLEWISGFDTGDLLVTVAVRALSNEGSTSPLVTVSFGVIDPEFAVALGLTNVIVSVATTDQPILTVAITRRTSGTADSTLAIFARDGNTLNASIAARLSINNEVLFVLAGEDTGLHITLQINALDANGRLSESELFILQVRNSKLFAETSFVRLAGLIRKPLMTLTLRGADPNITLLSSLSGATISLQMINASVGVLTVVSAYTSNITEQMVLVTLRGSTSEPHASDLRHTLTMRVTPFGLLMAGGEGVDGVQRHNEVWRFDTTDRYWERIGTLPSQLRNASPLFYNNTIFLLGGTKGESVAVGNVRSTRRVAYSDDGGVTWRETRSAGQNFHLPNPVANAVPIIVSGTLYMIGGRTNEGSAASPDTKSALDKNFVKTFNLSRFGQADAWNVVVNGTSGISSNPVHDNYYLNAAYQNFAGYLDSIFFSFGGRPNRFGFEGFNQGQLVQFSYTRTPTATIWLYGGMRINATGPGNFKTIGGQVAVFGGNGYAIGGESALTVPKNLYLRINTSALSRTTQPASQPELDVFTSANSVTGLPPANAIDTRYKDDGYRLFSLAKDHQPNLYMVGNTSSSSSSINVYVCLRNANCVNTSGDSGWTSIATDAAISSTVPSARSNFMLIGVNNISWNEGN